MTAARPFESSARLLEAAEANWRTATETDWLEAFSHHPRIGERLGANPRFAATANWSRKEQRGMNDADEAVRSRLDALNREYENRFGFVFLICATGKSAAEMLGSLELRLRSTREQELRIAAAEQAKITRLRLEKLISADALITSSGGGAD